jgi:hypothetical protein
LPVSLGVGGIPAKMRSALFETIRFELTDKGRLAAGFREGSAITLTSRRIISSAEIWLFQDEL